MSKKFLIRKTFLLSIVLVFLVFAGPVCKQPEAEQKKLMAPVTLEYWRVFDDSDAFRDIIDAYRALHPYVNIRYKKLRLEEYERELINAMAENRGPDIFTIHNTWIRGYEKKIQPLPSTITLPFQYTKGKYFKETIVELQTKPAMSPRELKANFIDQAAKDVLVGNTIYGLPLALDSLALFYNKNLLNAAGIPKPPADWKTFQENVKKLTRQDAEGNIIQAGAALGTSANVERGADILSLLMMQNGAQMTDERGNAAFDRIPPALSGRETAPGIEALIFYTDFASPAKEVYTWNEKMPNSLEAFVQGKVAFFFGYAYHIPTIKSQAPKLNLGITSIPQIQGNPEINFANYWVEVVSQKTEHINEAWDFLQFAASAEQAKKYLKRTGRSTALRALISEQLEDEILYPFVSQILTAKSWYQGRDAAAAEAALEAMIDAVVQGALLPEEAIKIAAQKVNQTLR